MGTKALLGNSFLKSTSYILIFKIIGMVLGYLTSIVIVKIYGNETMGIYAIAVTITTLVLTIANDGFSIYSMKIINQYFSLNKLSEIKEFYKKSLLIVFTFSIFISFLYYTNLNFIFGSYFGKENLITKFEILVYIFPPLILFYYYINILRGVNKVSIYSFFQNVFLPSSIILLIFINYFFNLNLNILQVYTYSFFIVFIILFIYSIKIFDFNVTSSRIFSFTNFFKSSSPFILVGIIYAIGGSIDLLLLGKYETIENVGIYAILYKISMLASLVIFAINTVFATKITTLWTKEKYTELKYLDYKSSKYSFFLTLSISLMLIMFSKYILLFFSKEYLYFDIVLYLLLLSWIINSTAPSVNNLLVLTDYQNQFSIIATFCVLIKIIMSFFLIKYFGLVGASVSTVFFNLLLLIVSSFYLYRKIKYFPIYIPFIKRNFNA